MKLITKTHKQMLSRYNYLFSKNVKTVTLSTGITTQIVNNRITVI